MDTKIYTTSTSGFDHVDAHSGKTRTRRTFSTALKHQMVEETLSGENSVSVVARRYDVNANQLFKWRRQYQQGMLGDTTASALIPITLNTDYPVNKVSAAAHEESANQSCIEITFPQGERVVICGSVCQDTLSTVLQALSS